MKVRRLMGSMVLVMALVMGLIGVSTPGAAASKTKKYIMMKGESQELATFGIGQIKSVSSSKSSVVKVKKSGKYNIKVTAKKPGKATVMAKGPFGYAKCIITVKKLKLACKYKGFHSNGYSGYAFYEVTNKSGDYISSATLTYDILDASGKVLKTASDMVVYALVPNAKVYTDVLINSDLISQGASAIKVKKYKADHNMSLSYSNYTKKVKVSYNNSKQSLTFKSKAKVYLNVKVDIVYYDADGKIVDVYSTSAYLSPKGKDTKTTYAPTEQYAKYKVFKRAYA